MNLTPSDHRPITAGSRNRIVPLVHDGRPNAGDRGDACGILYGAAGGEVEGRGLDWTFTLKENQPELLREAERFTQRDPGGVFSESDQKLRWWHLPEGDWPVADRLVRVVKTVRIENQRRVTVSQEADHRTKSKATAKRESTNFYATNFQLGSFKPLDFLFFFAHNSIRQGGHVALTRRQREVLDCVDRFIQRHGYSPSYDEIAGEMGLASLATVHKHLTALCDKGYLKRGVNQSRSLDLGPQYYADQKRQRQDRAFQAPPAPDVSLQGRIAAGRPIEAPESPESLSFADFLGNPHVYALQVHGESMIDDHILSGDYVLVERTEQARDGEIVVALVGGAETTLKRFYREPNGMARLQPANAAMEPVRVPLSDVRIQGRVLAVHRKYR